MKAKKSHARLPKRVLAVDPSTKGLAYVVFEGPEQLIDWGFRHVPLDQRRRVTQLGTLIERYQPDVLVLEYPHAPRFPRPAHVRRLLGAAAALARMRHVKVATVTRHEVFLAFYPATSKDQFAAAIVTHYPVLKLVLPKPRMLGMSEDRYVNVFDAAAFALAYFQRTAQEPSTLTWIGAAAAQAHDELRRAVTSNRIARHALRDLLLDLEVLGAPRRCASRSAKTGRAA